MCRARSQVRAASPFCQRRRCTFPSAAGKTSLRKGPRLPCAPVSGCRGLQQQRQRSQLIAKGRKGVLSQMWDSNTGWCSLSRSSVPLARCVSVHTGVTGGAPVCEHCAEQRCIPSRGNDRSCCLCCWGRAVQGCAAELRAPQPACAQSVRGPELGRLGCALSRVHNGEQRHLGFLRNPAAGMCPWDRSAQTRAPGRDTVAGAVAALSHSVRRECSCLG